MKVVKSLSIWIFGVLMFGLFANVNVHAADTSSIMKKWVFTGYAACARDAINTPLSNKENQSGLVSESVFDKRAGSVNLPSYGFGTNDNNSSQIDCRGLFLGEGALSKSGVLDYAGITKSIDWSKTSDAHSFLTEKVGYKFDNDTSNAQFFTISAARQICDTNYLFGEKTTCSTKDISSARITRSDNGKYTIDKTQFGKDIKIKLDDNGMKVEVVKPWGAIWDSGSPVHEAYIEYDSDITKFANKTEMALRSLAPSYIQGYDGGDTKVTISFSSGIINQGNIGTYSFIKHSSDSIANSIKLLSGPDNLYLTNDERYNLYTYYIQKSANTIVCENDGTVGDNEYLVKLKSGNDFKNCRISFNGASPSSINVNIVNSDRPFPAIQTVTLDNIINWLNNVDTSKLEDVDSIEDRDPISGQTNSIRELCEKGNLNGQGWILCPSLENLTYTANDMDRFVQKFLNVDTTLYDYDSAAYKVWQVTRSFANILMIIFLLFILFSQITGFGIDNYGIKKMLPRIIISAILINLSFVICTIVIDLSNILGVGLRDLFGVIGQGLEVGQAAEGGDYIATTVAVLMAAISGAGMIAPTVVSIGLVTASFPMIVVMVVLAVLGAVSALFIIFAMLSGRMVLIILCLSVAPVAFALYVLPNTQGLFKKWLSALKAVVVLFPICGALGGISSIIKGISSTTDDIVMKIIGILAPFVMFFLLPSLLRSALSSIGQIGSVFQSIGEKVSSGIKEARRGVQSSEIYRDATMQTSYLRAKDLKERLEKRAADLAKEDKSLSFHEQALLRDASSKVNFRESTSLRTYEDLFSGQDAKTVGASFESAIRSNDAERARAALRNLIKTDPKRAYETLRDANWGKMNSSFRQKLVADMGASGVDLLSGYAAYEGNDKIPGPKDFKSYLTKAYATRLTDKGDKAAMSLSKDDLTFILDPDSGIDLDNQQLGKVLLTGSSSHSTENDYQSLVNSTIKEKKIKAEELGFDNADQLRFLTPGMIKAMLDGGSYGEGKTLQDVQQAIKGELGEVFDKADRRTLAQMHRDTLTILEGGNVSEIASKWSSSS